MAVSIGTSNRPRSSSAKRSWRASSSIEYASVCMLNGSAQISIRPSRTRSKNLVLSPLSANRSGLVFLSRDLAGVEEVKRKGMLAATHLFVPVPNQRGLPFSHLTPTQQTSSTRRTSFCAGSPGLVGVKLELYQVAVGIPHVQGFTRPSGAYDVLRGAFDLYASVREAFGQRIEARTLHYQGEVIVTPGGDGLVGGIRPQMQDEPRRYSQRDEGMLSAFILVEAERLETQDVAIESQRSLDVPYPPVGVVSIGYLHRLSESFRSEPRKSGRNISLGQGRRPRRTLPARRTPPATPFSSPFTTSRFVQRRTGQALHRGGLRVIQRVG